MAQDPHIAHEVAPWFLVSIPETSPNMLARPELLDSITTSVERFPITLLGTPAGFGKTTALAAWARSNEPRVAWITGVSALSRQEHLILAIMRSLLRIDPENAELKRELSALADEEASYYSAIDSILHALPTDLMTTLVVDDADLLGKDAVTTIVVPLAQYSGGRLRIVLSGTGALTAWMTKFLADGSANIMPKTAVAFSWSEIAKLAQSGASEDEDLEATTQDLWDRTHGWPIAVRLLLHSRHLAGSDIAITPAAGVLTDFVESEILADLPDKLGHFILATTAVETVTPALASRITGDADSDALLTELVRLGFFLEPRPVVDGVEELRWNPTFASSCQAIAKRRDAEKYDQNVRLTAEALVPNDPVEAVAQSLRVADPEFAIHMIEDVWLQMILGGNGSDLETSCIQVKPKDRGIPSLLFIRACCRKLDGDSSGAQNLLARGERAMEGLAGEDSRRARITGVFADLVLVDEPQVLESVIAEAENILDSAPLSRSTYIHGTFMVAWTHLRTRYTSPRAFEMFTTVAATGEKAGFADISRSASATIPAAFAMAGRFTSAEEDALEPTPTGLGDSSDRYQFERQLTYWPMVFVTFWRGNLHRSVNLLEKMFDEGGQALIEPGLAILLFAYAAALLGDERTLDRAVAIIRTREQIHEEGSLWEANRRIAMASIQWARGDVESATALLRSASDASWAAIPRIVSADLWRRLGYPSEAMGI